MGQQKICFYGASMLRQPTGLVFQFRTLNPSDEVYSIAYGGTKIADAGICHINKVVDSTPNYCFIDWFSAQLPLAPSWEYLEACMDTMVRKLLEVNCIPIFLLFFRMDSLTITTLSPKRLDLYNLITDYCNKYNIDYIELFNNPQVLLLQEQNKLMADVAHTAPDGAKAYGQIIDKEFNQRIRGKDISRNIYPPKNELYDIKEYPLNANISEFLKIDGSGKIIGINQNVGPHTGIINIFHADGRFEQFNCWDKYCFYQRNIISRLDISFDDWVEIQVSQEEFDKSSSQKVIGAYTLKKMIKSISLFYIGDITDTEYSD